MNTKNTGYLISNRILKRKEQCRDGRSYTIKKLNYTKRKEDISERIISKRNKKIKISFSTKHRLSNERKRKMKI